MSGGMLRGLSSARVHSYRMAIVGETGRSANSVSDRSVQSLYLWQSVVASAWYEALSIFEPVLRNRIDCELRKWNQAQGNTEDWLEDPAQPLKKAVSRMASDALNAAESSAATALEQLRRLRNRVSHQEQILNVDHQERLADMYALVHAMSPQTLGVMKKMDRVQRNLLLRPRF